MPLDGLTLRCAVEELSCLCGASVQKIYQPEKDEIVFLLHTYDKNKKLLICASPQSPRLQLTEAKLKNPESAPMFCMLLRKYFSSSKLESIVQSGLDRTVDLTFECKNEMGDTVKRHIIAEIMGRNSNIIVTDSDYRIYDCLRKNDLASLSERTIMPGFIYTFSKQEEKTDITKADFDEIKRRAGECKDYRLASVFTGFSQLAEREAELCGDAETFVMEIKHRIENGLFTPSVVSSEDRIVDFWCFRPMQYNGALSVKTYLTLSEAMDSFYTEKDMAEHMLKKTSALTKLVANLIKRAERKIKIQTKELAEAEKKDEYKNMGDLITANIYKIKKGDSVAEVSDWSDGTEKIIHIPMDKTLSPAENAQRWYKKYAKAKNAEVVISEQIATAKEEASYLESVLLAIADAEDMDDIAEIKDELAEGGYIKREKSKKKKENKNQPIEDEYMGFKIFVGKNNKQNDYLTLKIARANDMWLHVKNSAGSHVIISSGGNAVPDEVIYYAASLAAKHSKAKGAPKTEVDYTKVKYVKKPAGAKPGMVIYTDYKTCVI